MSVLDIEGVAAQVYARECCGNPIVIWWDSLREDIKKNYRWQAKQIIGKYIFVRDDIPRDGRFGKL